VHGEKNVKKMNVFTRLGKGLGKNEFAVESALPHPLKKQFTLLYVAALMAIGLLSFGSYLLLTNVTQTRELKSAVLDVSRQQRMLSQHTTLLALQLATTPDKALQQQLRKRLREATDLMEGSHVGLLEGDATLGLSGHLSQQLQTLYFAGEAPLDLQVKAHLAGLRRLLASPDEALSSHHPDLQTLLSGATPLLESLITAVTYYEREAEQKLRRLERVETALLLVILFTLVLVALLRFRAIARELQRRTALLEDSEARFRSTFANAAIGMALVRPDGSFLNVNEAACSLWGYAKEDMLHKTFQELTHPQDLTLDLNYLNEMLRGERQNYQMEKRYYHKKGHIVWAQLNVSAVYEGKSVKYFISQIQDISFRKKAEMQLAESEERFRTTFHSAAQGMALVAVDGYYLQVNQSFCDLLGYSESELLQKRWQDVTYPEDVIEDAIENEQFLPQNMNSGPDYVRHEKRYLHKDGTVIWALLTVSIVRNQEGKLLHFINQVYDITDRKHTEVALQASEERYRTMIETMNEGLTLQDAEGKIIMCNTQAEKVLGLNREEMMGRSVVDGRWRAVRIDGSPYPRAEMPAVVTQRTGQPQRNQLMGIHKPSGELVWLLVNASPLADGVITTFTDVTPLKTANVLLEQRALELEQSNRDLQDFAHVASHDLQEPLRMVSSYVQLLEKRYKDKLDDNAKEFIHYAVDGAKRMQHLVNDLLTYSRVASQHKPQNEVRAEAVLKRALKNLEWRIEATKAQISHDPLPLLRADETQLMQLFQNLLGNALKFNQQQPVIHISASQQGNSWRFCVQDNGIGMKAEELERIFKPFQRLHTREDYEGTGIGLSLCRRIVERHGGRLWVESEVGKGSSFFFTLPEVN
jgi:PAS domain S-box-containing protein